jgi:hypothetical protein
VPDLPVIVVPTDPGEFEERTVYTFECLARNNHVRAIPAQW